MNMVRIITVLVGVFLLSGCGDQVWCGENGCGSMRGGTPSAPAKP